MPEGANSTARIHGWAGIARHLHCDVTTAIRWAKEAGLPVHQPSGRRGGVHAFRHELDRWLAGSYRTGNQAKGRMHEPPFEAPHSSSGLVSTLPNEGGSQPSKQSATPEGFSGGAAQQSPTIPTDAHGEPLDSKRQRFRFFAFWTIGILATLAGIVVVQLRFFFREFENGGETLIASENSPFGDGLVAGGGNLYFSTRRGGRVALLTVPETGGQVREISVPFIQAYPQALSTDGKRLLVLVGIGQEKERQLWWVPLNGGTPLRLGTVLGHSAALSPDGRTVAFAFGTSVFLTASDSGVAPQLLYSFSGVPSKLCWSLDGMRIIAYVNNSEGGSVIWKLFLDKRNPASLTSYARISQFPFRGSSLSPVLDEDDDLFFSGGGQHLAIYILQRSRSPVFSSAGIKTFANTISGVSDFALDRVAHELYFGREITTRDELNFFDQHAGKASPFMPGISARDVDFSRDGRRIAYVTDPGSPTIALWVAGSDGSHARQIDTRGMSNLELPRWSPDGKQLAFMGQRTSGQYRIYVVPASGGEPREASHSSDNQGAPTWSPDGRGLVYGRVFCQEEKACGIFHIDLASGNVTTVSGSDGLSTARWSPDGRYIAALRADTRQLFLFDQRIRKWRKLADGVNGDDLAWSPDSRAVYASRPDGAKPSVLHISLSGKVEEALDLSPWTRLTGRVDTWFTVAPDGSLVFERVVTGMEIVALHYEER